MTKQDKKTLKGISKELDLEHSKGLTGKEIIMKELEIWQTAHPKQKKLLEDFANKIYFELRFKYLEKLD